MARKLLETGPNTFGEGVAKVGKNKIIDAIIPLLGI